MLQATPRHGLREILREAILVSSQIDRLRKHSLRLQLLF